MFKNLFAGIGLGLCIAATGQAAIIEVPLPSNTFITMHGLDWAWAFPLPASEGLDLSYQSAYGWRMPTLDELLLAPLATDFKFPGANVPLNGQDRVSGATFQATNATLDGAAACATPYFSNSHLHCDWQDGNGQIYEPWAGLPGARDFADQLVVRAVPEPASIALLCAGLAVVAARRRIATSAPVQAPV